MKHFLQNEIFERLHKFIWPASLLLISLGFFIIFYGAFPGLMTTDSFDMWNMGVDWEFTDWDAPLISVLMFFTSIFRNDPGIYLFLQLLLFWSGVYIYSLALREQNGRWPILSVCIGLYPPIIGLSGYLHKTPLQSSFFLFVFSVLYYLYVTKKDLNILLFIILVLFLFIGTVIRDYTYLSAFPILLFLFNIFLKPRLAIKRKWIVFSGSSLLLLIIFNITHNFVIYTLLKSEKEHKIYFLLQYELAGIYSQTGIKYAEKYLAIDSHETAKKMYKKHHGLWKIYRFYRQPKSHDEFMEMMAELIRAILQNPTAYLKHRLKAISGALGIHPPTRTWKFLKEYKHIKTNKYGIEKSNNVFYSILNNYQMFTRKYFRFILMPWFYAILNIYLSVSCAFKIKNRDDMVEYCWPHCIILWSGFLFLLIYILICNANLNRYSYWLIVSTCFGGFGLFSIKNDNRHEEMK